MASKILKAGGKLLGIGKKKPAETPAAPTTERKGPIITPLGGAPTPLSGPRRRRRGPADTILSDKLGA